MRDRSWLDWGNGGGRWGWLFFLLAVGFVAYLWWLTYG